MKKVYLSIICLLATSRIGAPDDLDNEFVQHKKRPKRVSLDTLKKNNIERCSEAFESSASLVEGLGRFQKSLKRCVDEVFTQETRTYHEQAEQRLVKLTSLLHQMENVLATCEVGFELI